MVMSSVTGIDDRNARMLRSHIRGAFLRMTHCHDIRVAGDDAGGIRDGFTLGCGAGIRGLESHDASAETEHGGFKGKAGPGTGLVKAGRKLFSVAHMCVGLRPLLDVIGEIQERDDLFHGEIERIQQVSDNKCCLLGKSGMVHCVFRENRKIQEAAAPGSQRVYMMRREISSLT